MVSTSNSLAGALGSLWGSAFGQQQQQSIQNAYANTNVVVDWITNAAGTVEVDDITNATISSTIPYYYMQYPVGVGMANPEMSEPKKTKFARFIDELRCEIDSWVKLELIY